MALMFNKTSNNATATGRLGRLATWLSGQLTAAALRPSAPPTRVTLAVRLEPAIDKSDRRTLREIVEDLAGMDSEHYMDFVTLLATQSLDEATDAFMSRLLGDRGVWLPTEALPSETLLALLREMNSLDEKPCWHFIVGVSESLERGERAALELSLAGNREVLRALGAGPGLIARLDVSDDVLAEDHPEHDALAIRAMATRRLRARLLDLPEGQRREKLSLLVTSGMTFLDVDALLEIQVSAGEPSQLELPGQLDLVTSVHFITESYYPES